MIDNNAAVRKSSEYYKEVDAVQRRMATDYLQGNLLVAAAAGSGKTSALTTRVLNILKSTAPGGGYVRLDQLTIVTFTEAATQEMRERIGTAIEREIPRVAESGSANAAALSAHLGKQLNVLSAAPISTIHSLCSRLVRQNGHLLGIDPAARLADEKEFVLLQRECLEEMLEERYKQAEQGFLDCVAWFCGSGDDAPLRSAILRIYEFACNRIDREGWLGDVAERFWPENGNLTDAAWGKGLAAMFATCLQDVRKAVNRVSPVAAGVAAYEAMNGRIAAEVKLLDETVAALVAGDYDAARRLLNSLPVAKMSCKGFNSKDGRSGEQYETLKAHLAFTKGLIKNCQEYLAVEDSVLRQRCAAGRQIIGTLADLALEYGKRYSAGKLQQSVMDFNDLERLALELLRHSGFQEQLRALQTRMVEIITDEYQDTNEVQEAILTGLAGNGVRRFMVGDLKQSIYGFRQADPDIFRSKKERYSSGGSVGGAGQLAQLAMNFRSRPEVLKAANFVFGKIMSAECGGEDYDEAAALKCGRADCAAEDDDSASQYRAELIVIDKEEAGAETTAAVDVEVEEDDEGAADSNRFKRQAQVIANRIKELLDDGFEIHDRHRGEKRKLEYRDCVVLLRKRSPAAEMLQVLLDNGIPAFTARGGSYFDAYEIKIMLALLAVIDNPLQDVKLGAALHSPLFGFSAAELAQIRLDRPGNLWAGLTAAADAGGSDKVTACVAAIQRWRQLCRQLHIHELLQLIYRESGFYDFVGALPGGRARQANLQLLQERALDFELNNYRGMFRFLKYVERLKSYGKDFDEAGAASAGDNAVQIMTVHGSKGLEYPVVFLADAAARFGKSGARGLFELNKSFGIGMKYVDLKLNAEYKALPFRVIGELNRVDELAEEMRLLYVAMTRAREKLIVIAELGARSTLDSFMKDARKGIADMRIQSTTVRNTTSWLGWIMAAVEAESDNCWNVKLLGREQVKIVAPRIECSAFADVIGNAVPADPEISATVSRHLDWKYPHQSGKCAPKLTVSELKRLAQTPDMESESVAYYAGKTSFGAERQAVAAAALGTAYHEVFRRLDLNEPDVGADVTRIINMLQSGGMVAAEVCAALKIGRFVDFARSGLAAEIRQAATVRREQPFVLGIPARVIDGSAAAGENVLVQGIIDLFFTDSLGRVKIVDFKTDRNITAEELIARYRAQLDIYARAVREIAKCDVIECIIWHVHESQAVVWRPNAE